MSLMSVPGATPMSSQLQSTHKTSLNYHLNTIVSPTHSPYLPALSNLLSPGLHFPPHTGLADWLLALLDKEAHQQQLLQRRNQCCSSSKGGSNFSDSSSGAGSIGVESRSSSFTISGGGDCCKGSILLHARSGSSSSDAVSGTSSAGQNTMSAAWRKYAASGRAAAAAAPFIPADSELTTLNSVGLPGLSEITEASSDDDADIIITTIVVDSPEQQSASSMPVLPAVRSGSTKSAVPLAPPCRGVLRASLGVQIRVLSGRAFMWWLRNPAMLLAGKRAAGQKGKVC